MLRRISAGTLRKGGIGAIVDFESTVANSWIPIGAKDQSQCHQALIKSLLPAHGGSYEGRSPEEIVNYLKDTTSL